MLSKSFVLSSAGLTNINLVTVYTSNAISYSLCFSIMVSDYCNSLVLTVFIVVVSRIYGQGSHLWCLHLLERPFCACKNHV